MDAQVQVATQTSLPHRLRIVIPRYPAFNIYSRVARCTTALGPVCIASIVNKMPGWEVEVIDENNYRNYGPKTAEGVPDHKLLQKLRPAEIVGFYGGLSSTIPRIFSLAAEYKEMGAKTIAGGLHFVDETLPEALANNLDLILLGEADDTIQEVLPALISNTNLKQIPGLAFLEDGRVHHTAVRFPPQKFDHYPIPDFSLVRYAKITLFPVSRVRGCGMNCEFCTVKGAPRYASPEKLLAQFMSAAERWNAIDFFIVDDLFGQDREETLRFCKLLKEYQQLIRRSFFITAQIRLDKAHDPVLLTAMREAGIRVVAIGFESPIPEELKAMNKHLKPEEMIAMARVFHEHGFLIHGMFIFGYPLKDHPGISLSAKDRLNHMRRFIRKAKIDTIQVLLPIPLPGTEMTRRLEKENRIFSKKEIGWEYYDGNFPVIVPDPPLTAKDLLVSSMGITGFFYRFKEMFSIGFHCLSFPIIILWFYNLKAGWLLWYKGWRNSKIRFGGWLILRHWKIEFKKSDFIEKLKLAEDEKKNPQAPPPDSIPG